MDLNAWLAAARADAIKRKMPELVPLLENLAASTAALRKADEEDRGGKGGDAKQEQS